VLILDLDVRSRGLSYYLGTRRRCLEDPDIMKGVETGAGDDWRGVPEGVS